MRRADPHRALIRALSARYPGLRVLTARQEPWASATFTGARHVLACAPIALAGLADAELPLPGHIVADIVQRQSGAGCTIEALTVETD